MMSKMWKIDDDEPNNSLLEPPTALSLSPATVMSLSIREIKNAQ